MRQTAYADGSIPCFSCSIGIGPGHNTQEPNIIWNKPLCDYCYDTLLKRKQLVLHCTSHGKKTVLRPDGRVSTFHTH